MNFFKGDVRKEAVPGVPVARGAVGLWSWFALRLTGALLVLFLLVHLGLQHLVELHVITFDEVVDRLANRAVLYFDFALLVLTLIHGALGLRRVTVETFGLGRKGARVAGFFFGFGALAGFFYGVAILRVFI